MLGVSSSFDKSLPWLSVPNSYKLRGCDIISERILFAAQEVLTPLLFSAVARALVVGQQQDYSVLGASPAAYILVAAFSSRIVRNFPASDRTFSFSFIYNMVRSLGTSSGTYLFEERPNTVVDKSFQFAIANVCDVFNEESSQSFVAGIKEPLKVMDGAASLFDILHVVI